MDYTEILVRHTEHVSTITLHRPQKLNALTLTLLRELRHAMREIKKNRRCRVVVITGAGRAFSAGVDLSVFEESKVEPGFDMHTVGMEILDLIERSRQIYIAKVNGYCFTGAMELMMAFDLVVAAKESKIGDTHAKWGIPPKWGMTQRLQNLIGVRKAKELSFTAKAITGAYAAEIGLVNKAVPLAELQSTTDQMIEQILGNSGQTIAAVKQLYQFGNTHLLQDGLDYERDYQMDLSDKTETLKNFKKNL